MTDNDNDYGTIETQEARLSRIERVQARTVANLETVSTDISKLAGALDSLREHISNHGKTQWNVLGTWVGVLMAIGAAVIAPQMTDISELEQKVSELSGAIQENAVMLGRLEERERGGKAELNYQTKRTREEIDWVWDLLHSRFGYRDPDRQRHVPNKQE